MCTPWKKAGQSFIVEEAARKLAVSRKCNVSDKMTEVYENKYKEKEMHLENDHGENSQTEKEKDIEAHAIEVENAQKEKVQAEIQLLYTIDENPPWHLAVALGFQHYVTMFGGTFMMPFLISVPLCFSNEPVVISNILNTILFTSGMVTFLQATFGCRLPIVQGCTFAFLAPTFASMAVRSPCPSQLPTTPLANQTINGTNYQTHNGEKEWKLRLREIQGAIIVAAIGQMVIGFSGLMGLMLRFIGPLTIVPTITLVGLPLFETAYQFAGVQWGIAILTIILITLFFQVLKEFKVPIPAYSKGRFRFLRFPAFKLFPIIIAVFISWAFCAILTATGVFGVGHKSRTDIRISVLKEVSWLRIPYPGQWGAPIFKLATIVGMFAGVISSMLESIGDYYACARISGAPTPPKHAINRGLGIEGFGCLLTGVWGSGSGTTSYSENIGAVGITRVGSRRVIQYGALFMIILSLIGKFGALFVTIPDPVVGGVFIVLFGVLIAVGLSPLQFVDMDSMRNLFIIGFSMFFGLVLPLWLKRNPKAIQTGSPDFDQVATVLLSTSMAVGGITGFILDNLLPGSLDERGLKQWKCAVPEGEKERERLASIHTYDIPFITPYLQRFTFVKYLPFLPYYDENGNGAQFANEDTSKQTSSL